MTTVNAGTTAEGKREDTQKINGNAQLRVI